MRLCQAFTDCDHEVVLTGLASRTNVAEPISYFGLRGGFRVIVNSVNRLWDNKFLRPLLIPGLVLAWQTRKLLKSFKPDIIYSRLTLTELAFVPGNLPILYEMHSLKPLHSAGLPGIVFKYLVQKKYFVRIVATTEYLANALKSELPDIDVIVARLSSEPAINISPDELNKFSRNQLMGNSKYNIGYTGALDKDGLRGTKVICDIASRLPDYCFHIVGGKSDIVEYWQEYSRKINSHNNLFFYGHRNPSQIPYFLNLFDIVLAPLQYKPSEAAPVGKGMSPLKLSQYMAYSKAIVASDIPAHREILQHEVNAYLVKSDNIESWTEAVKKLLIDKTLRDQLSKKALNTYYSEFTPQQRVHRIVSGIIE